MAVQMKLDFRRARFPLPYPAGWQATPFQRVRGSGGVVMKRVRRSKLASCGLMSLVGHGAVAALIATAAVGLPTRPGGASTSQVPTFVELRDPPPPDPVT